MVGWLGMVLEVWIGSGRFGSDLAGLRWLGVLGLAWVLWDGVGCFGVLWGGLGALGWCGISWRAGSIGSICACYSRLCGMAEVAKQLGDLVGWRG